MLDRYQDLRHCEACGKIDEDHLREIGFEADRILAVGTDFWGNANDTPKMIVRQRVKDLFLEHRFEGVDYIPCGKNRSGENLFVLWKQHESRCLAPPPKWCYKRPDGQDLDEGCCTLCRRSSRTLGYPYYNQLSYPSPTTISVPDIPTGIGGGQEFRFFCSQVVRDVIRQNKLSGLSLADVRYVEKFYPRSPA